MCGEQADTITPSSLCFFTISSATFLVSTVDAMFVPHWQTNTPIRGISNPLLFHAEKHPSVVLPSSLRCSLGDRFQICPQHAPLLAPRRLASGIFLSVN